MISFGQRGGISAAHQGKQQRVGDLVLENPDSGGTSSLNQTGKTPTTQLR